MFKCKDCNEIYDTKPDYCNCGNNTFEQETPIPSPVAPTVAKKTFFEQYPQIKNFIDSIDILSGCIFVLCLILSVFSWNLIGSWKPSPTAPKEPATQEVRATQNTSVPDINNIWNSTPPQLVEVKSEPIPALLPPQEKPPVEIPKQTTPVVEKPTPKPLPTPVKPKPQAPTPVVAKPKSSSNLLNNNLSSMSPEMKNYTEGLKSALFSQWAVGSISGNGLCEVEFSISPSGKLLGRRFSKQSDNSSLNNATYDMLMSLPQYSSPPDDYNGEKIRVSFYINQGYYEVKMPRY